MIGRLLGQRYQVVELLGKGGFGHTYIALDTHRPGNPACVVKHLKPATSDPEFLPIARRLFNREAETLEKLGNHDQIPRLLAYLEENEEFYLVQELIAGQPLSSEMLPGAKWSEEQVTQLLQEILPILVFIHSNGVIHRDLKPDNLIRRASDNKIVLVDFGAVKQIKSYSLMTTEQLKNDTVPLGTPGYMPSEQVQGRPRPCSDIYALGMIAIQSVTGLIPQQLAEDPVTGEILWQHHAQISEQLADFLSKMVRHYFKYRYQSATDALKALNSITNTNSPTPVALAVSQVINHYLANGYVSATKMMHYMRELAKPCYTPPDNATIFGLTSPPITAPTTPLVAAAKNARSMTSANKSISISRSRTSLRAIFPSSQKSQLLKGAGAVIAIFTLGIISANTSQQLSPEPYQNRVKQVTSHTNDSEKTKNCLIVLRSSNLRSVSRRTKTGKVIKAGTRLTVTGREEKGWIEISSPESGWIWKGRTKNTCPKK
ncbi:serine/threonine protein kinase [Nostoc sp. PCC 7524]|uniref:serine/threonine-protein kinase n=1 Tax=Nostoc sp. (strain ATCC 29411 / PCC 7524) TaxID=28072 RepID=UPI00029F0F07|nr:serine/threonine-protein kinase [Nostoc sp. PCC 7524]AFY47567.1 serine/threonine protein kinase [Nostoc sp. PCC 7524]